MKKQDKPAWLDQILQVTATTMTPLRCYENSLKSSIFAGYFQIKRNYPMAEAQINVNEHLPGRNPSAMKIRLSDKIKNGVNTRDNPQATPDTGGTQGRFFCIPGITAPGPGPENLLLFPG